MEGTSQKCCWLSRWSAPGGRAAGNSSEASRLTKRQLFETTLSRLNRRISSLAALLLPVSKPSGFDPCSTSPTELPKPTMDYVNRSPLLIPLHHKRLFDPSAKSVITDGLLQSYPAPPYAYRSADQAMVRHSLALIPHHDRQCLVGRTHCKLIPLDRNFVRFVHSHVLI
jgi:hypothetical protein